MRGLGLGWLRVVDLANGTRRVGEALDLNDPVCPRPRLLGAADAQRVGRGYRLRGVAHTRRGADR